MENFGLWTHATLEYSFSCFEKDLRSQQDFPRGKWGQIGGESAMSDQNEVIIGSEKYSRIIQSYEY